MKLFECMFFVFVFSCQNGISQRYKTIYQKIQQEPAYSEFNALVHANRVAKLNLHYEQLTVFVPENRAFKYSEVNYNSDRAFYHMSFEVKTLEMLNRTNFVATVILENPPLWITHSNDDIYINNAKIIREKSNYLARSRSGDMGKQQVLHMIDEVLDPIISTPISSPNAFDLLASISNWNLGAAKTVSNFLTKVQETRVQYVFKQNGGHTFFIPLDTGVGPYKFKMIDKNIIFGHVVPFRVLFTRPTPKNLAFESLANDDNAYIGVSFREQEGKLYVKGIMTGASGDGDFYSEIVVPNIPVKNGVVHLISQPLGVYARNLKPFPYLPVIEKVGLDPNVDIFYEMGERTNFNQIFSRPNVSFTFFVPQDASWKIADRQFLETAESNLEILGRHLIISHAPYSIEQLLSLTKANNYTDIELPSESGPLRIMVLLIKGEYYLKWYNRFIKIVRPNYECSDGVVHVLAGPMAHFRRRNVEARDVRHLLGEFGSKISDVLTKIKLTNDAEQLLK